MRHRYLHAVTGRSNCVRRSESLLLLLLLCRCIGHVEWLCLGMRLPACVIKDDEDAII